MKTCEQTLAANPGIRSASVRPCGRKAIAWEVRGNFDKTERAYCKIHCQAAVDKRHQDARDHYESQMAPKYYQWEAAEYCKARGLTLEDLKTANQSSGGKN